MPLVVVTMVLTGKNILEKVLEDENILFNSTGEPVYRKVAVVENFFDIIYNVHVDLEGRPGKHAGQKRTYRTITETYAFLPREAVTRFLLGCTECQKHPRSPSPTSLLPTPSPSPTLPPAVATLQQMGPAAGNTPTVPQVATPVINNSVQQGEDSYYGVKNGAQFKSAKVNSISRYFFDWWLKKVYNLC
ncbi:unnamed protein product [Diabrotica balteata]|uniref:Integrase zinc-binding domain-containing protein n=1 Tax=Diabrotica balteata TaxID=107213 RepID=A0A9N9T086_DIABA|nr:unnamed protein product [Diabrotica balteata]